MPEVTIISFDVGIRDMATTQKVTKELLVEYINTESPGIYNAELLDGQIVCDTDFFSGIIYFRYDWANLFEKETK